KYACERRQQQCRRAIGPTDDQRIDLGLRRFIKKSFLQLVELCENGHKLSQKEMPGSRQYDASFALLKEFCVLMLLQQFEMLGDRGLTDVKRVGCSGNVEVPGNRRKDYELLNGHGSLLPWLSGDANHVVTSVVTL